MPKIQVKINFSEYETDFKDKKLKNLQVWFYEPFILKDYGLNLELWKNVAKEIGGEVVKYGNTIIKEIASICPVAEQLEARRFIFHFLDGRSVSIPFSISSTTSPDDIIAIAKKVMDLINAKVETPEEEGAAKPEIVCIKLRGERIWNAIEYVVYEPKKDATVETAGHGDYASGYIEYASDIAGDINIKVRVNSKDGSIPPIFSKDWAGDDGCVGDFLEDYFICGNGKITKHRRLIFDYKVAVTVDGKTKKKAESRELPLKKRTIVLDCMESVLTNSAGAVYCVVYIGEDRENFISKITKENPGDNPAPIAPDPTNPDKAV